MNRKIRVDENGDSVPDIKHVLLHRVIGFCPELGVLVYELPKSGERYGVYLRTGSKVPVTQFDKKSWIVDETGLQREIILERYNFIDPPKQIPRGHSLECNCQDCKDRRDKIRYIEDFGQPGD